MAANAGFGEIAEPAVLVPQSILAALEAKEFHTFPDTLARQVGDVYEGFATNIIDASLAEG